MAEQLSREKVASTADADEDYDEAGPIPVAKLEVREIKHIFVKM